MRAAIVAGVLGLGTVLVFGAALLTASLFPNGTALGSGWNGWNGGMEKGWGGGIPVPVPAPDVFTPVEETATDDAIDFQPLPGDIVVGPAETPQP
jgi:hypothetical protein